MTKVAERLGLTLANHYGLVDRLDPEPDIVLLPHSTLRCPLDRSYRAIRLVRDPRDIWVSGYLYHLRCDEQWCLNTDLDPTPPIRWPKVDFSVQHWPEDWKRYYLERLGGKSYQQNLLDRSLADGLDFELEGYTGCTFRTMRQWELNGAVALDVKLEDVMADFDAAMQRVFDHFCFTEDQSKAALEVARSEDVRRLDDAAIAKRPQIHSRTISKWRGILSAAQIARFEESHGDLIREFGYEPAGVAADAAETSDPSLLAYAFRSPATGARAAGENGPPPAPAVAKTPRDGGISLSADGLAIRPTAGSRGIYTFVVPSGAGRVRLEPSFSTAAGSDPPDGSDAGRAGVRVSKIAIRSDMGEVVIAADDPRLNAGWHDAERAGGELWRLTDGSAEVPWDGIRGPAVVDVFLRDAH